MDRGCLLEKRCQGCRELGLTKRHRLPDLEENVLKEYLALERIDTPDPDVIEQAMEEEIADLMWKHVKAVLNEREYITLRWRFGADGDGEEATFDEIGKILCVTRERVRQIWSSAIKKLKHPRFGERLRVLSGRPHGLVRSYFYTTRTRTYV